MINQITVNSSNAIQLSRGQLLCWVNELLGINIVKIQQLGTGAIYCQMLDILYQGKVQLSKVNFKAKNDYEYINNFKVLQQYFTKLGIMKHIQVQKLVKCKYQDNLEFLQWFKKIFDTSYCRQDEYSMRRSASDNDSQLGLQKQNRKPVRALNFNAAQYDNPAMSELLKLNFSKQGGIHRLAQSSTSRINQRKNREKQYLLKPSTDRDNSLRQRRDSISENIQCQQMRGSQLRQQTGGLQLRQQTIGSQLRQTDKQALNLSLKQPYYSPSKFIQKQDFYKSSNNSPGACSQEKQFYLRKFKQIQHILQIWSGKQDCSALINQIRKVILLTPEIKDWSINQLTGQVQFANQSPLQELQVETKNNIGQLAPFYEQ